MTTNISLNLTGSNPTAQENFELVYFDSSSFYDWDRHWEEEE
jgi:hypothetical protein